MAIAPRVPRIQRLAIQLGDQYVGNGAQHWLRRTLKDIGERDVQLALAQPDCGVERGEAAEAHMERRYRGAWPNHTIFIQKDLLQLGAHDKISLALRTCGHEGSFSF